MERFLNEDDKAEILHGANEIDVPQGAKKVVVQ